MGEFESVNLHTYLIDSFATNLINLITIRYQETIFVHILVIIKYLQRFGKLGAWQALKFKFD